MTKEEAERKMREIYRLCEVTGEWFHWKFIEDVMTTLTTATTREARDARLLEIRNAYTIEVLRTAVMSPTVH